MIITSVSRFFLSSSLLLIPATTLAQGNNGTATMPKPRIYLADNSLEPNGNSFCIDLPGSVEDSSLYNQCWNVRGATCRGATSEFFYIDEAEGGIESKTVSKGQEWLYGEVENWSPECTAVDANSENFYRGACLAVPTAQQQHGGLVSGFNTCRNNWGNQRLFYTTSGKIQYWPPDQQEPLCMGMGETVEMESEGVYVRDLVLMDCDLADVSLITWMIVDPKPTFIINDGPMPAMFGGGTMLNITLPPLPNNNETTTVSRGPALLRREMVAVDDGDKN